MTWQDIVISFGTVILAIALVPSLASKDKPPAVTSLVTGLTLFAFAITYSTFGLWFSFAMNVVISAMWLTLACQKRRMPTKRRRRAKA